MEEYFLVHALPSQKQVPVFAELHSSFSSSNENLSHPFLANELQAIILPILLPSLLSLSCHFSTAILHNPVRPLYHLNHGSLPLNWPIKSPFAKALRRNPLRLEVPIRQTTSIGEVCFSVHSKCNLILTLESRITELQLYIDQFAELVTVGKVQRQF